MTMISVFFINKILSKNYQRWHTYRLKTVNPFLVVLYYHLLKVEQTNEY